jgi:glutathione S-transferase
MAKKIELWWISGSPYAWRVMLALEVKQLAYETHLLVASDGQHKQPDYLAINPRGKVPAIRIGDFVLRESLAIMQYLDRAYPEIPLFGAAPEQSARIWQAALEADTTFAPVIIDGINRPVFFGKTREMADEIKQQAGVLHELLGPVERTLETSDWIAGEQISAADIALYPFFAGLLRASEKDEARELDLGFLPLDDRYPNLDKWCSRITALPRYIETVPLHWRQDT